MFLRHTNSVVLLVLVAVVTVVLTESSIPLVRRVEEIDPVVDNALSYRLPNNTSPRHYDITLNTNIHLNQFEFTGLVKIDIFVDLETSSFTLHHRQLTIVSVKLFHANANQEILLGTHSYDPVTEFLTIPLASGTIAAGNLVVLHIDYRGTLRTDNGGFYRSSYVELATGATK